MTYKHLNAFLAENEQSSCNEFFDLIPNGIKSKIILAVGKGACNTAAYLSSVMSHLNISHSKYVGAKSLDLKNRFIAEGRNADINELCNISAAIAKKTKRAVGSEELCFLLALKLLDGASEYLIITISDAFYLKIAGRTDIPPHAVIFTTFDDALSDGQKELVHAGAKEIIMLSQKDDRSYISSEKNTAGVRTSNVSANKIVTYKTNLMGTEFYYNSQLYHIVSIDKNNVPLACLAVEAAKNLFKTTYPLIYKGLKHARAPIDLELYSLSPAVFFKTGKNDFSLPKKMKFDIVTDMDGFKKPTENTIFCGSPEFIDSVKEKLK